MTATIFDLGSRAWPIGLGGVPGLISRAGVGPPLPGGVPGAGVVLPLPEGVPGAGVGLSSSSQLDDLMRSCMNTPGGGFS
jgi:hypothetical protein